MGGVVMKGIKGIFFDIGWTLCYPTSGNWMITKKCLEYADQNILRSIPKSRLESAYEAAMKYLDDNHLLFTEDEEFAQFKIFYNMLSMALPELGLSEHAIEQIAADKVYNDDNYIFYDDVKPALENLSRHYKLGIISDTWPSAMRFLKSADIYDYFDSITFSCNLGVFKPHAKMYEHATQSIGLPPSETVFVDDSLDNLEGANTYGIIPLLIERENYPHKVTQNKFSKISTLSELLDI